MCLDTRTVKPTRKSGIGYKVMGGRRWGDWDESKRCAPLTHVGSLCQGNFECEIGVWTRDNCPLLDRPLTVDGWREDWRDKPELRQYKRGMHVWRTPEGCLRFYCQIGHTDCPVFEVEYRDVVASGKQYGEKVDVVREIRVVKKIADNSTELRELLITAANAKAAKKCQT